MIKIRRSDSKLSEHQISQEEREHFIQAIADVSHLSSSLNLARASVSSDNRRSTQQPTTDRISCKFITSDSYEPVSALQQLSFHRTGNRQETARLKSGSTAKHAKIDLHGYNIEQAAEQLSLAVEKWLDCGYRVVQIVHGKGTRRGYSVIKSHIPHWLQSIPQVIAYTSCRHDEGGAGAVKVLLKKKRNLG